MFVTSFGVEQWIHELLEPKWNVPQNLVKI